MKFLIKIWILFMVDKIYYFELFLLLSKRVRIAEIFNILYI
jgi:hypothetical protein